MKKIVLIAFALLCMLACRREPKKTIHYLDPSVDAFISFDTGSYWIYIDSVSGRTDSFVVYRSDHQFPEHADDQVYEERGIGIIQYKNKSIEDTLRWSYNTGWLVNSYKWYLSVDSIKQNYSYVKYTIGEAISRNLISNDSNYKGYYHNGLQSFDSAYIFLVTNSIDDSIRFYFRRHIGPVKIEYMNAGGYKYSLRLSSHNLNPSL